MSAQFDLSRFTEQLLAPLPDGTEAADSKEFRRQIKKDMTAAWHPVWLKLSIAKQYRDIAMSERAYAGRYGTLTADMRNEGDRRHRALVAAVADLMDVPAPTKTDLREKISWQKFDGGYPAWDAAIAADHARLCGGEA